MTKMRKLMDAARVLDETPLEPGLMPGYKEAVDEIAKILYRHLIESDIQFAPHTSKHLQQLFTDVQIKVDSFFGDNDATYEITRADPDIQ